MDVQLGSDLELQANRVLALPRASIRGVADWLQLPKQGVLISHGHVALV